MLRACGPLILNLQNDSSRWLRNTDPALWFPDRAHLYGHVWMEAPQVLARNVGARIPLPMHGDFPHFDLLLYNPDLSLPANTDQIATLTPLVSPVGSPSHTSGPSGETDRVGPPSRAADDAMVMDGTALPDSRASSPSHNDTTRVGEDSSEAISQGDVIAAAPPVPLFLSGTPSPAGGSPAPALPKSEGGDSPGTGPIVETLQGTFLFFIL